MKRTWTKLFRAIVLLAPVVGAGAVARGESPDGGGKGYTDQIKGTDVKFDMVKVAGGKLTTTTGSKDGKPREVDVKPFHISKHEVSWDEYDVFYQRLDMSDEDKAKKVDAENRPSEPYLPPDRGFGHQGYPAGSVASNAAVKYCEWVSKKTGKKYRLPTEYEWEFAATGGDAAGEPAKPADLEKAGWLERNAEATTHPIGKKASNKFGLFDMLGNVAEWVTTDDGKMVVKGGSFVDKPAALAPTARGEYTIKWQADDPQIPKSKWWLSNGAHIGIRLVSDEP